MIKTLKLIRGAINKNQYKSFKDIPINKAFVFTKDLDGDYSDFCVKIHAYVYLKFKGKESISEIVRIHVGEPDSIWSDEVKLIDLTSVSFDFAR